MQKQHTIILLFLMSAYTLTSFAMELIELTKSPSQELLDSIAEQQHGLNQFPQTHHALLQSSLQNMRTNFLKIPDDHRHAVLKTMSTQLLLLSCVAIYLPQEIIQNHFCLAMMNNHKEAAEQLYTIPLNEHFTLYHALKMWVNNEQLPIEPLYVAAQSQQEIMLKIKRTWYRIPVMNHDEKKEYDEILPEDLKQMYLQGKFVLVLPKKRACNCITCGICVGCTACIFGSVMGIGAAIGATFGCGPSIAFHPATLGTATGCSSTTIFCATALLYADFQLLSEIVTW